MPSATGTGFVYHPHYLLHDTGFGNQPFDEPEPHVEHPRRVSRIKELVDKAGLTPDLAGIEPYPADFTDIERAHDHEYVMHILREAVVVLGLGDAGGGTRVSRGSFEIAMLAAGGVMAATDAVLQGKVRNAYALVRPPGHHAIRNQGMGFCIFNNVAVAALHARARYGVAKIMVVDWDVHHGNGTQDILYHDPSVLTVSLHQDNLFPASYGLVEQVGEGRGEGYNVNIPLPAGSGDKAYLEAFERVVVPIAKAYGPDLLYIASGLDASRSDPLGRMLVSSEGYRAMCHLMKEVAEEFCDGRVVVAHEGGYSQSYAPYCGLAITEELLGRRGTIEDGTYRNILRLKPTYEVGLDAQAAIAAVVETQRRYWPTVR